MVSLLARQELPRVGRNGLPQTQFNRYGCVATGRSRCATRQGALFGTQPKERLPLLCFFIVDLPKATTRHLWPHFHPIVRSAKNIKQFVIRTVLQCYLRNETCRAPPATSHSSLYRFAVLRKTGTLGLHPYFPYGRVFDMDRGWSMQLSSILLIFLFALALIGIARANNQQAQQSCVNAAICLLAVRSGLIAGRRSDLQTHYTSLAFCAQRGSLASVSTSPAIS
jgi:hypothetical protein